MKIAPSVEDQLWRSYLMSEENCTFAWQTKFGWLMGEYTKLQQDLEQISKNSALVIVIPKKSEGDKRSLQPFPCSSTGQVGWLASRKDWLLEIYGPDKDKGMPFVNLYP